MTLERRDNDDRFPVSDTDIPALVSLDDLMQFKSNSHKWDRPLHENAVPSLQITAHIEEPRNAGDLPSLPGEQTVPRHELQLRDEQSRGYIARPFTSSVDLIIAGKLKELKDGLDGLRKAGDDAEEVAAIKMLEKETGLKFTYDKQSLTLSCVLNPGVKDAEKKIGITVDKNGKLFAWSSEQVGLGSAEIVKPLKVEEVMEQFKKIATATRAKKNSVER